MDYAVTLITIAWCFWMVCFACYHYGKFSRSVKNTIATAALVIKELESIRSASGISIGDAKIVSGISALPQFSGQNAGSPFGRAWAMYSGRLIELPAGLVPGRGGIYSTNHAGEFFHTGSLVDSNVNMSLIRVLPSLMTGFGILGTFMGLFFGLSAISSDYGSTDAMGGLLSGAGLAFLTSIFGLTISLGFNCMIKAKLHVLDIECNKLSGLVDSLVPTFTNAEAGIAALQQSRDTAESVKYLRNYCENYSSETSRQYSEMMGKLLENVKEQLTVEIANMGLAFVDGVQGSSANLAAAAENFDKASQKMTSSVAESIRQLNVSVNESMEIIGRQRQEFATQLDSLVSSLRDASSVVSEESIVAAEKFREISRTMVDAHDEIINKNRDSFAASAQMVDYALDPLMKALDAHVAVIESAGTTVQDAANSAADGVTRQLQIVENASREIAGNMDSVSGSVVRSADSLGTLVQGFGQSVGVAKEMFDKTGHAINGTVEKMKGLVDVNDELLRSISGQSEDLKDAIVELRSHLGSAVGDVDNQMARIVQLLDKSVTSWNASQMECARELKDLIREIQNK